MPRLARHAASFSPGSHRTGPRQGERRSALSPIRHQRNPRTDPTSGSTSPTDCPYGRSAGSGSDSGCVSGASSGSASGSTSTSRTIFPMSIPLRSAFSVRPSPFDRVPPGSCVVSKDVLVLPRPRGLYTRVCSLPTSGRSRFTTTAPEAMSAPPRSRPVSLGSFRPGPDRAWFAEPPVRQVSRARRVALRAALVLALASVSLSGSLVALYATTELPPIPPLPEASVLLDRHGTEIAKLHAGIDRTLIP